MELTTLMIGTGIGIVLGALLFTPTGRDITRAGGERTAHAIRTYRRKR